MRRRDFIRTIGAGAALAAAGPALAQEKPMRPNILFAFADDWSWPQSHLVEDPVLEMPTFDRLRREGVTFRNAYVSAPSCTPSRGAILTGQYHWRLEQGGNLWSILPAKFAVYPDQLEAAGYHVGFCRKGWGPGNEKGGGRTRNPAGNRYVRQLRSPSRLQAPLRRPKRHGPDPGEAARLPARRPDRA